MGKRLETITLDGSLDKFAEATVLHVTAGEPISFADMGTKSLATVVLAPGDFTKAAGDTDGRKVTVSAKADLPITATGSADHVAIGTTTGSVYLGATTTPTQPLTSGGTVSVSAWAYEQGDPV